MAKLNLSNLVKVGGGIAAGSLATIATQKVIKARKGRKAQTPDPTSTPDN